MSNHVEQVVNTNGYGSEFHDIIDFIINRHMTKKRVLLDNTSIDSSARSDLRDYVESVESFIYSAISYRGFNLLFQRDGIGLTELWREIRSNEHVSMFVFDTLSEFKMYYNQTNGKYGELLMNVANALSMKETSNEYSFMDKELLSSLLNTDEILKVLMDNQWLLIVYGISLIDLMR